MSFDNIAIMKVSDELNNNRVTHAWTVVNRASVKIYGTLFSIRKF